MALFGSNWKDDSEEDIGPLSHWLEDFEEEESIVPASLKEAKKEQEKQKDKIIKHFKNE